jgi:hypothetical protein
MLQVNQGDTEGAGYLVARSRCTKFSVSRYLMPDAICAAIYRRQLKLKDEKKITSLFDL